MAGTKTNERQGTRAKASYVRSSDYKAREVLDLIRGKSYAEAAEILQFSERGISEDIRKVINSAVATAEHNDNQVAAELYVSACYADEGPTLKRWRPRARGRATRIRKRTCHITVIVGRYDDEALEALRNREAAAGRSGSSQAAEASRARVAQSKARQQEAEEDVDDTETAVEDVADEIVAATAAEMEAAAEDDNAEDNVAAADAAPEEEEEVHGTEGQPVRLPPRDHHRLEEPLVRRSSGVRRQRRRGLEDPRLPAQPVATRRDQPCRGRAHP